VDGIVGERAEMPNVLYIDDEPALLELTSEYFRQNSDIEITGMSSARKALEFLGENDFDVLVSDYQMPEMDGISLLKVLRERGDRTPFILFTGRCREEVAIEALNRGADFFIQKCAFSEVSLRELKNAIIQLAAKRTYEDALIKSEQRYRAMFEESPLATSIVRGGQFLFTNTSYLKLFGFQSVQDLIHHSFIEMIAPEYQGLTIKRISDQNQGERIKPIYESMGIRADGTRFHALIAIAQIELSDGPAQMTHFIEITDCMIYERNMSSLR
jgi:PAS domain S-box-containing protein